MKGARPLGRLSEFLFVYRLLRLLNGLLVTSRAELVVVRRRPDRDRRRIADESAMTAVLLAHLLVQVHVIVGARLFNRAELDFDMISDLELVERDLLGLVRLLASAFALPLVLV
jgi:hypothetical protein